MLTLKNYHKLIISLAVSSFVRNNHAIPIENEALEEADFNLDIDSKDFSELDYETYSDVYENQKDDSEYLEYYSYEEDEFYSYYDEYGNMLYYGNTIENADEVLELYEYDYEYTIDEETGERNYEYYYVDGEYDYVYEYVDSDDSEHLHEPVENLDSTSGETPVSFGFRSGNKENQKGKKKVVKKVPKKKKKKKNTPKNGETRKQRQKRLKNTPLQIVKDSNNPFDPSGGKSTAENFFVDFIKNPSSYTESLKDLDQQIAELTSNFDQNKPGKAPPKIVNAQNIDQKRDGLRSIAGNQPNQNLQNQEKEDQIYEAPPPKVAMDRKFQLRREQLSPIEMAELNFSKDVHKNGAVSTLHMIQALICRQFHPEAKAKDFKDCPVSLNQIRAVLRNYGCNCYSENFDNSPVKANTDQKSWHMGSNGHGLDEVDNQCQRLHDSYRCIAIDTEQELLEDPKKKYNTNREDNCGIYVKFPYYINDKAKDIKDLIKCNSPRNPDWSVRTADSIKCWQAACFIEREFAYNVYEIIGAKPEEFFNDNILNYNVFTNKTICHHRPIRSQKKAEQKISFNNSENNLQNGPIDAGESNGFRQVFDKFENAAADSLDNFGNSGNFDNFASSGGQNQNSNNNFGIGQDNFENSRQNTKDSMQQYLHRKPDPLHVYALAPGLHGKANACCGEYPKRMLYNDKQKVCENDRILDINIFG